MFLFWRKINKNISNHKRQLIFIWHFFDMTLIIVRAGRSFWFKLSKKAHFILYYV